LCLLLVMLNSDRMQIVYFRSSQQEGNAQDEGLSPSFLWRPKS
jgi:hypothetical protein